MPARSSLGAAGVADAMSDATSFSRDDRHIIFTSVECSMVSCDGTAGGVHCGHTVHLIRRKPWTLRASATTPGQRR